jgi:predicted amidohydrolase
MQGDEPGILVASLALDEVKAARSKIPNLKNARSYRINNGLPTTLGEQVA